jgi:hypothetical protein
MITVRPRSATISCLVALAVSAASCDDDTCKEPDVRGAGAVGDPCVTVQDCAAGLACIGTNIEDDAHCAPSSDLPGGADPGCLEPPDEWPSHQAHGVEPISTDDQGCKLLIFDSACNCEDSGEDGGCTPVEPFYRSEAWRSCNDCCWRLVAFWNDTSVCPED